jgi:hypothetical protein
MTSRSLFQAVGITRDSNTVVHDVSCSERMPKRPVYAMITKPSLDSQRSRMFPWYTRREAIQITPLILKDVLNPIIARTPSLDDRHRDSHRVASETNFMPLEEE